MQDDDDVDSTLNLGPMVNPDDICWDFALALVDSEVVASTSAANFQLSESGQDDAEGAHQDQMFTSLLQRDQPTSTTGHSTNEFLDDIYSLRYPESSLNTSAQQINDFEGRFEFQVMHPIEDGSKASKSASWTYSSVVDKLFVKMNVNCPLLFKIKGYPPFETCIRATPVYIRPEDMQSVPKRCLNHATEGHESNRDHPNPEHLIRCSLGNTEYIKDEATGRMSTVFPYVPPDFGSNLSSYLVRFMCQTSCAGGMNRRPIAVVFSLEHNGKCLGRQMRNVKVCACPGRDRQNEELRIEKCENKVAQDVKKACKRIGGSLSEPPAKQHKVYTISVYSKAHYNILRGLIPILERNIKTQEESSEEEG